MLPPWGVQVCQVLAMLAFAPLISGLITKAEARVQWRKGPSVLQPYFDIANPIVDQIAESDRAGGEASA
jgi:formate hydrogenlyase subunit 4